MNAGKLGPFSFLTIEVLAFCVLLWLDIKTGFNFDIDMMLVILVLAMMMTLWFVRQEWQHYLARVKLNTHSKRGLQLRVIADGLTTLAIISGLITGLMFQSNNWQIASFTGVVTIILAIVILWLLNLSKEI